MLFYISFITSISFFLFLAEIKKNYSRLIVKLLELSAICILIFVVVFRFDVGFDYVSYYGLVSQYSGIVALEKLEFANQILVRIARCFNSPGLLFIFYGLPTYLLIIYTLKKYSKGFYVSLYVFLFLFFFFSVGAIRQMLALAITFWAYRYIVSKSFIPFLVSVIIASLFHISALIALIIYPLYHYLNVKQTLIIGFGLLLFYKLLLTYIGEMGIYSYYIQNLEEQEGGSIVRLFYVILFGATLIMSKIKGLKIDKIYPIIILALFFPFIFGSQLGLRISYYFFIYFCLLIPNILTKFNVGFRILFCSGLFIYFLLILNMSISNPIKSPYVPYQFIFAIDNPVFR